MKARSSTPKGRSSVKTAKKRSTSSSRRRSQRSETSLRSAKHTDTPLKECVVCGSRRIARRLVTVQRRDGRQVEKVAADVCEKCGERYFDLEAMRLLER
ncbi:MAG: YgiT-type zinc finger protein [Phycisphaerales bacterium]|nr:YgiT-type zinc finger protein [Phycisphaerales bacterium]